jgi:RHS repeat-associated protein
MTPDQERWHTLFRRYSSTQGRWLSPDPGEGCGENPQTLNLYPYVGNNPTNRTDPKGNWWWDWGWCDPWFDPYCGYYGYCDPYFGCYDYWNFDWVRRARFYTCSIGCSALAGTVGLACLDLCSLMIEIPPVANACAFYCIFYVVPHSYSSCVRTFCGGCNGILY